MSKRPPLLEDSRLGLGLVLFVGLGAVVSALTGLEPWLAAGLYVGILSLCAALLFAWDKKRAAASKRRVSEANLWIVLLLGGALGAWIAMLRLRHKTRRMSFRFLAPFCALAHIAAVIALH